MRRRFARRRRRESSGYAPAGGHGDRGRGHRSAAHRSAQPTAEPEDTGETGLARPTMGAAGASGTAKTGEFASVSAGDYHTCGVNRDSSVECWGNDNYGQATPPTGEFASVSAGYDHACGMKRDGSVECWGSNEDFDGNVIGQATPPAGEFASVNAGDSTLAA